MSGCGDPHVQVGPYAVVVLSRCAQVEELPLVHTNGELMLLAGTYATIDCCKLMSLFDPGLGVKVAAVAVALEEICAFTFTPSSAGVPV